MSPRSCLKFFSFRNIPLNFKQNIILFIPKTLKSTFYIKFFNLLFVKTDKSFQSLKIRFIFKKLCNIKIEANSKTQLYLTLLLFIWSRMAALVRLAILRSVSSLVHRIKKKKPIISMYIKALYVHRYIWFLL